MGDRKIAALGTLAVVIHAIIAVAHGIAHSDLGVQMAAAQNLFINLVIGAAPILAAVLLWTKFGRLGAFLLVGSMTGSLLFGVYYHYVAISPDNVFYLREGSLQWLFHVTAFLLPMSEAFGIGVGVRGLITRIKS